jgi:hypothetical protein
MAKLPTDNALQNAGPINVALQRPTVNLKEAENVAEQARAVVRPQAPPTFGKHATFYGTPHHIEGL